MMVRQKICFHDVCLKFRDKDLLLLKLFRTRKDPLRPDAKCAKNISSRYNAPTSNGFTGLRQGMFVPLNGDKQSQCHVT